MRDALAKSLPTRGFRARLRLRTMDRPLGNFAASPEL